MSAFEFVLGKDSEPFWEYAEAEDYKKLLSLLRRALPELQWAERVAHVLVS